MIRSQASKHFLPTCTYTVTVRRASTFVRTGYRVYVLKCPRQLHLHPMFVTGILNKKLSYCWETARRESMPRIAEMDVEMIN